DLTHNLENVFDSIREGHIQVQVHTIDVLFETVDELNKMVEDIANGGDGKSDVDHLLKRLTSIENGVDDNLTNNLTTKETNETSQTFTTLDEFEISMINESTERGYTNYEITVTIREDCLLKGVRAFMVFEALEQLGEIIKSEPSVNDLEEEKFAHSFV